LISTPGQNATWRSAAASAKRSRIIDPVPSHCSNRLHTNPPCHAPPALSMGSSGGATPSPGVIRASPPGLVCDRDETPVPLLAHRASIQLRGIAMSLVRPGMLVSLCSCDPSKRSRADSHPERYLGLSRQSGELGAWAPARLCDHLRAPRWLPRRPRHELPQRHRRAHLWS
jgi:hypothetical protein